MSELPADIAAAIVDLEDELEAYLHKRRDLDDVKTARAALDAAILARLAAVEAEILPWARAADDNRRRAEAAIARAERLEKALEFRIAQRDVETNRANSLAALIREVPEALALWHERNDIIRSAE